MKLFRYTRFLSTLDGFKEFFGIDSSFLKNFKSDFEKVKDENEKLKAENKKLNEKIEQLISEINANNENFVEKLQDLANTFKVQVSYRSTPTIGTIEGVDLDAGK